MTGLTRAAAARIIAGHFGTQATHVGGGYDTYTVRDEQNRQWKLMSDASIRCRNGNNRQAGREYSVELVSPICQYADIETIQEIVRKLRGGGAKVNDDRAVLQSAKDAMDAGCKGLMIGRNVWGHSNIAGMARALNAIVHGNASVDEALKELQ